MDIATLAELLHETGLAHHPYEQAHPPHDWWDWYAPYLHARQQGSTPEEAAKVAEDYMAKLNDARDKRE